MSKSGVKSRIWVLLLVVFMIASPLTVFADTTIKKDLIYVSLGDSLAKGMDSNRVEGPGYVDQITKGLEALGYQVSPMNQAVSGATSGEVLAKQLTDPALASADIITISSGANDLLAGLDMMKIAQFNPAYADPTFIHQQMAIASETLQAKTGEQIETVNHLIDDIAIDMEALHISFHDDLKNGIAPYEAFSPKEMQEAFILLEENIEAAKSKAAVVPELVTGAVELTSEAFIDSLQVTYASLAEVAAHLAMIHETVVALQAQLETLATMLPELENIAGPLETVRKLTIIPQDKIGQAAEGVSEVSTALETFGRTMNGIETALTNASEVAQMFASRPAKIAEAGNNLAQIIGSIQAVNPNAKIYVLGYYNALPHLSADLQEHTVPLLTALNDANEQVALTMGATFIPTFDLFVGKQATHVPNPADIHPSEAGYKEIANAFLALMTETFPGYSEEEPAEVIPPVVEEEIPVDDDSEAPVSVEDKEDTMIPPEKVQEKPKEQVKEEKQAVVLNKEAGVKVEGTGKQLPNTATNQYNMLFIGAVLLLIGGGLFVMKRWQNLN